MKVHEVIALRLAWHRARMQELVAGGMDRIAASEAAYQEVTQIKRKDLLAWSQRQKQKAKETP